MSEMKFELDRDINEWRELTARAIAKANKLGARFVSAMISIDEGEDLGIEGINQEPAKISETSRYIDASIGVRLVFEGTWGFAAGSVREANVEELAKRAVNMAKVNSRLQRYPVDIIPIAVPNDPVFYTTDFEIDPFTVPWEEKLKLLLDADEVLRTSSSKVSKRQGTISLKKQKKILATTDGLFAVQSFMRSGASIEVNMGTFEDDIQRRSYPDSHYDFTAGGWEHILRRDLVKHAAGIAEEAERLFYAPYCPHGTRDIIMLQSMANLHCGHESIHGFEADRILGTEWTLAGGSFLTAILPEIGNYRFGSKYVTIVADSLHPQGVGTFAYDDEGTPGQKNYLVKDGILVGLLTSRETVTGLNRLLGRNYFKQSGGTMRAMNAKNSPLIRMVNILIQPGEMSLEEMKDKVPVGTIMLGTNKSWSIDDIRRHFNFGVEIAWEKVSDNRWELRKNATYAGDNLTFFRSCKGFANQESWVFQGIGNCGKDIDPVQAVATGHGCSPGWFEKVKVSSVGKRQGGAQ